MSRIFYFYLKENFLPTYTKIFYNEWDIDIAWDMPPDDGNIADEDLRKVDLIDGTAINHKHLQNYTGLMYGIIMKLMKMIKLQKFSKTKKKKGTTKPRMWSNSMLFYKFCIFWLNFIFYTSIVKQYWRPAIY